MTEVRVGIISDLQYADVEDADGRCLSGKPRHYRQSLAKAAAAMREFEAVGCCLAVNLGDSVDRQAEGRADLLDRLLAALRPPPPPSRDSRDLPVLHLVGNHELSTFPRPQLLEMLGWRGAPPCATSGTSSTEYVEATRTGTGTEPGTGSGTETGMRSGEREGVILGEEEDAAYGCFPMCESWSAIVLDTYDLAVAPTAYPPGHPKRNESVAMFKAGYAILDSCFTLHPEINGGVGSKQLEWLGRVLIHLRAARRRAVVFTHAPLFLGITMYHDAACWNRKAVCLVLKEFLDVVALCVSGHDHFGGAGKDEFGINHVVIEAAVESGLREDAHAILHLPLPNQGDVITITSTGHVRPRCFKLGL
ncbi:manganese-dependent ADP-ribose/CDP-alcohol diphosphatase [Pelomyxa schiedti]|nr:manganese-dependent ADP-ribose/CDP-alcohol diphosphatase [Pelomyxa schiedti]